MKPSSAEAPTSPPATAPSAGEQAAKNALSIFHETRLDHASISSDRLDLVKRKRTSLLPWRGQFSPDLVELLLTEYATKDSPVLDLFAGSGTVLFECARMNLPSIGVEINPAAVLMARTTELVALPKEARETLLSRAETVLKQFGLLPTDRFAPAGESQMAAESSPAEKFRAALRHVRGNELAFTVIANILIGCRSDWTVRHVSKSLSKYASVVRQLPVSSARSQVIHCDGRATPLDEGSVSLILTSPPYVNVFNYHQNYRPALEVIGWDMLEVARSEIGANRKHRGNRFLTVIQYGLDMAQALKEARRVLRPEGRLIVVVGRESNVRGVPISNSRLLSAVATAIGGFSPLIRQERKFTTRFGELIYEDILHFAPTSEPGSREPVSESSTREIARQLLTEALPVGDQAATEDLLHAIHQAESVGASPMFEASASTA